MKKEYIERYKIYNIKKLLERRISKLEQLLNEKERLGFLGKLRFGKSTPEKDLVNTFNSNVEIVNSVLGDYFHFSDVSIADIKEVGKNLKVSESDSYIDDYDQKYLLTLTAESYYSESYNDRNISFTFSLAKERNHSFIKFCYEQINDSVDDMKKSVKQISEKALKRLQAANESCKYEAEDLKDVIVKVGNKWRIRGKKQKYWDAEYDTKEKAQAALRAYWANKHESLNKSKSLVERYRESK